MVPLPSLAEHNEIHTALQPEAGYNLWQRLKEHGTFFLKKRKTFKHRQSKDFSMRRYFSPSKRLPWIFSGAFWEELQRKIRFDVEVRISVLTLHPQQRKPAHCLKRLGPRGETIIKDSCLLAVVGESWLPRGVGEGMESWASSTICWLLLPLARPLPSSQPEVRGAVLFLYNFY